MISTSRRGENTKKVGVKRGASPSPSEGGDVMKATGLIVVDASKSPFSEGGDVQKATGVDSR